MSTTRPTSADRMSSMERVLTTLSFREPDRVPLFLLFTLHGAKVLGVSIRDYFADAANVVEGQLRLRERFGHDCFYGFFHAPIEVEAWGGEVIYVDDGPPNAGEPLVRRPEDIERLTPPVVRDAPCLRRVLDAIAGLKERSDGAVPIIGVAMSPFSLPVMQMGFEAYIELLYERPELLERLLAVNEAFCVEWANAQLAAGATAICYFDPVCSPTIVPAELARRTGFPAAARTIARIQGPTATHLASGRGLSVLDDLVATGTAVVGVSADEDLREWRARAAGRVSLLGNLNGIEMRRWSPDEAAAIVREALAEAGPGGGFILSDQHGEIPWQVPDDVLLAIAATVREEGRYPLGGCAS